MKDMILSIIKAIVAKEPARFIAYGSVAGLFLANKAAEMLGVTLPPEVVTGAQALGVFIVTELIRRLVFAPATVAAMASDMESFS